MFIIGSQGRELSPEYKDEAVRLLINPQQHQVCIVTGGALVSSRGDLTPRLS